MFLERELNTTDYILCMYLHINITLSYVHKTSQYVEEDLNKILKVQFKDHHSMKGNTICLQNYHSLKSYKLRHITQIFQKVVF